MKINKGMVLGCNHPIGPLALADLIGLETLRSTLKHLTAYIQSGTDTKRNQL